jgi:uncharacterized membrane protein YsdA (DUF1294 family)
MIWLIALSYLVTVNCAAFVLFWHDKNCARQGLRRIPESTLLQLAFIGGSIGAFAGRSRFRHKTLKQPFSTQLQIIGMLQLGVGGGLCIARAVDTLPG